MDVAAVVVTTLEDPVSTLNQFFRYRSHRLFKFSLLSNTTVVIEK